MNIKFFLTSLLVSKISSDLNSAPLSVLASTNNDVSLQLDGFIEESLQNHTKYKTDLQRLEQKNLQRLEQKRQISEQLHTITESVQELDRTLESLYIVLIAITVSGCCSLLYDSLNVFNAKLKEVNDKLLKEVNARVEKLSIEVEEENKAYQDIQPQDYVEFMQNMKNSIKDLKQAYNPY